MGEATFLNSVWFRRGRRVFALAMGVVLAWVLINGASQITWAPELSTRFAIAAVISTLGLVAASAAWAAIIDSDLRMGVATLGATMPLRHLPMGGVAQVVGMAGLAKVADNRSGTVAYTTPAVIAATAAGAAMAASPVAFDAESPWWVRALVGVSLLAAGLLMWRGHEMLRSVLLRLGRRDPGMRRSWLIPLCWSAVAALASSASFAVLAPEAGGFVTVAGAFAASWLCGYVVFFAPAGLGVREGVLVLLLGGMAAPTVIATGLLHRLATLVGELLLLGASSRLTRKWEARGRTEGDR